MAGTDAEFLESKRLQYGHFTRILFWSTLACLTATFGVVWVIS
jgi:hypothetical protein